MSRELRRSVALGIGVVVFGLGAVAPVALAGPVQPDPFATVNALIDFGTPETPPIPADFFGPGSDPFDGPINLGPAPNGLPDTLVQRFGSVVCPGAGFPRPCDPTPIEIVELSLVSIDPIIVTFNGGQNPEEWQVSMGLSAVQTQGNMNAVLEHANGGTFTATLPVTPRLVFTPAGAGQLILDFDAEGIGPIPLTTDAPFPWVVTTNNSSISAPSNGNFVPLVDPADQPVSGTLASAGGAVVHVIEPFPLSAIPTVSTWGMAVMLLLVVSAASIVLMRRRAIHVAL